MFKIPRPNSWPPMLDLATVRETLLYMKEDFRRVPELARAREAIETAIAEIEKAERTQQPAAAASFAARFLPRPRAN
jgi:hypothetical protein